MLGIHTFAFTETTFDPETLYRFRSGKLLGYTEGKAVFYGTEMSLERLYEHLLLDFPLKEEEDPIRLNYPTEYKFFTRSWMIQGPIKYAKEITEDIASCVDDILIEEPVAVSKFWFEPVSDTTFKVYVECIRKGNGMYQFTLDPTFRRTDDSLCYHDLEPREKQESYTYTYTYQ